jgi:hypothetical protein
MRNQQTDGQLQQQHNIQAELTKDNKKDTFEADTYTTKKYTWLIRTLCNDELIRVSDLTKCKYLLSQHI